MATANKLMTHMVAGYPSTDECIELMLGMQRLGVGIIEIQIPFSDPIADGETIMRANDVALENGMSIEKSFELIQQARKTGLETPVYVMSYLQKVIHLGARQFCAQAADCGASGLIIPDLPFDSPEYEELELAAKANLLQLVPVISPGMEESRLSSVLPNNEGLVYLTSMKGITGKSLSVSEELTQLAERIKKDCPKLTLAIGFGVQSAQDVKEILAIADMAVAGSSVIREIEKSGVNSGLKFIENLTA